MNRFSVAALVVGTLAVMFGTRASAEASCPQGLVRASNQNVCVASSSCSAPKIRDASGACVCPGGTITDAAGVCRDPLPACPENQVRDGDTHKCGCPMGTSVSVTGRCNAPCPAGQSRDLKSNVCVSPKMTKRRR